MADQMKWFKLWCSAPADDSIQSLPPSLRWAWVVFGCYTKLHGEHGVITISHSNSVLAAQMAIPLDQLKSTIEQLPHISVQDVQNSHGEFTVTWRNWVKYQEDSTQAARQMSRRKRRGEERRSEENKIKNAAKPLDAVSKEPEIEPWRSVADRIFNTDKKRYLRLIVWIKWAAKHYHPQVARIVLEKFEPYSNDILDWYPYLVKMARKEGQNYNERQAISQHEVWKNEAIPDSVRRMVAGIGTA